MLLTDKSHYLDYIQFYFFRIAEQKRKTPVQTPETFMSMQILY